MSLKSNGYSVEELMAVTIARDLRDGEKGLTGFAGSGRAGVLAVGIPLAAMALARKTHAPNLIILLGAYIINPDLTRLHTLFETGAGIQTLPAQGRISTEDSFGLALRGEIDFGFSSGAQVDRLGNVNITCIGKYEEPKVRLVGCIFQTEHYTTFQREYIMMEHSARSLVPAVDFITAPGYISGGNARQEAGLSYGGPRFLLTDRALFTFDSPDHSARLASVHAGQDLDDLQAATGFPLQVDGSVKETPAPTAEELEMLRRVVDPHRVLLAPRPVRE